MFSKIIVKNFKSNLHNYILFFISNILAVTELVAFWGMNDIVMDAITDDVTAAALRYDFWIAAGLITVITVLLMVFSMKHYIQLRMKDYSTFVTLGMRKRTSYLLLLTEYSIGGVASLVLGSLLGVGLLYGGQYWLRSVYPEFIDITGFNLKVLRNAWGLSIGIMALVFVGLLTWMDGKDMSALMSTSDCNEKRPVSKRSLLLAVLGIALLVFGEKLYQGSDMMYLWSHVVWLLGMILVVAFGMAGVLEWLRKRRKFYMRHIFQLNQFYSKFQNNLLILVLLMVIHFFALTYLATEITNILPLDKYRENYPYDNVWIAKEDDQNFAEELSEKYDGSLKAFPMVRAITRYGGQQIGLSASTYEKLSGRKCDLKGRDIWLGVEDMDFQEEKEAKSMLEDDLYEYLFVGNYDPEFNLVMAISSEEGEAYHYKIQKAFTQSVIGQYSMDQYHENLVVFSDACFEEHWKVAREDETEASMLFLFNFPSGKRGEATKELKAYDKENGIKNKDIYMLESSLYNTEEYVIGQKMRTVFSLSSKLFLMADLLISGFFVVGLKTLSEMGSFRRRYDFLNCMGMKAKGQGKNIRFETRILTTISVGASLVMGLLYVGSYAYQKIKAGDTGIDVQFWKYWIGIVVIYLIVVYLIQELFARYVIHKLNYERRKSR